jgi:hypothetical protein
MSFIDWATLIAGIFGLVSITIGAGMVFLPAGFIVAGISLLGWSYLVARAGARGSSKG